MPGNKHIKPIDYLASGSSLSQTLGLQPETLPEEFVIESDGTVVDPNILMMAQLHQRSLGKTGRSKNLIFSEDRGRYIKAMMPKGEQARMCSARLMRELG